ncbi:LacI family DNA-binding transcriptional regulator [Bacillus sp. ISL-40]|uniref:LacI family DNA-binding transcriptional regulator n=1 Tax=unclassified Bacillus (in: firmicutes) TaxID=185979 RepID=UPI001BEC9EBC|nr:MULTISPECIES: LacI family DNA-binding transcriptional regulator [unclassified Bacillus (in: firmicutes)]MBT2700475.1 LacI family DNA-binding transcriptional regulator [Bacillus sp. ISL-40]MBT2720502.1 LacI family DNA-binding transcriptional regulator [Bacillus sp. ISL-46]MBT2744220.1 LacI family DNA-binding transcriptional regulator [Bacillus sp. ISL-77]
MKIDDIAKLANVSKSAVSLALNGKNGVSQKTREKVLRIAQEHGYIPRPIIKADQYFQPNTKLLRFIACTNVGIVTEQYESLPFFMELIHNLDKHIGSSGYSLTVSSISIESLQEEVSRLEQEQKSAGILLLGTNLTPEQINIVANIQPNIVVLDTCFETLNVNFVVMNNVYGAYQAGQYLNELGHEQIGYVGSNTRMYNFDMRKKGFLQALTEHGLKIAENNYFSLSPTVISSQDAFKEKIKKRMDQLPTALFCEADYMAISVIKSLTELGIKVPEDISVIGFDNIFESQVITPELTTIHVKKDKIALLSVEKLIRQIENNDSDKIKLFVDTELIERNSCTVNKETT